MRELVGDLKGVQQVNRLRTTGIMELIQVENQTLVPLPASQDVITLGCYVDNLEKGVGLYKY